MTVFQRRHNVILSTLNQHQNLMLKQRCFWVDTENILLLSYDARKIIVFTLMLQRYLYFNVKTTSFDQRCINVKNLTLKQRGFLLEF